MSDKSTELLAINSASLMVNVRNVDVNEQILSGSKRADAKIIELLSQILEVLKTNDRK